MDSAIPYSDLKGAHVVLGLSGGVDSSLSAALLKEQGLNVTALFMKNWEEDDTDSYCAAAADREDAQAVCDALGIELVTINFAAEYWERVFEIFLSEYRQGRTPNPDILCNREIKFKAFLDYACEDLKADYIATGHYCRRSFGSAEVSLLRGSDPNKDQSYFLHYIDRRVLPRTLFPVGHLFKAQVREMAAARHLRTAAKKDSTGICFIGEKRFRSFLKQYLPAQPGPILSPTGQILGEHEGLMYSTIGQRKGLNIGGTKEGSGEPWYVAAKDFERNALIVVQGHDHPLLLSAGLMASRESWLVEPPALPLRATCKVRYRQPDVACLIERAGDRLKVSFERPVNGVAPGQSVVFYEQEVCLGGAIIEQALSPATAPAA